MTFKITSSKRTAEMEAASREQQHLMEGIEFPGLNDVLCGRGGHATNHPGNVQFRQLVAKYKDYYMGLSRYGKLQVAAEVVKIWRSQTPPGRFLAMTDSSRKESTQWFDIGDKEAIKKTSQCLRERIPPNQKARTLTMIAQKAKKNTCSSSGSSNSGSSSSGDKRRPQKDNHEEFEEWEQRLRLQQQQLHLPPLPRLDMRNSEGSDSDSGSSKNNMSMNADMMPRPILEPATVSVSSSAPTVTRSSVHSPLHQNSADGGEASSIISGGESSLTSSNSESNLRLGGGDDSTRRVLFNGNNCNDMPPPQAKSHRHQHQASWTTQSWAGSSDTNNDLWLSEMMALEHDETEDPSTQQEFNNYNFGNNHTSNDCQSHKVDAWMIPSAANLTRDVFDDDEDFVSNYDCNGNTNTNVLDVDDIVKPLSFTSSQRHLLMGNTSSSSSINNLNSTLSSGMANLFATSF